MRDGTVKLLLASQQPKLMVEAAKNLLASNARVVACTAELQHRKTDQVMNYSRWVLTVSQSRQLRDQLLF